MRDFLVEPSFNGIGAAQTASITLPVGNLTYHKIVVQFGCSNSGGGNQANTTTYVTGIRLKLNGKVQRTFSAAQLIAINAYYGHAFQGNGYLEIFLSEPWKRTPQGEDALAWGMADIATFQIEVDLAAGVTSPTLTCHAEIERVAKPNGIIAKWRSFTVPVSTTGIFTQSGLPKGSDAYAEIHCFNGTTADIADVTVTVDGLQRYKATNADTVDLLTAYGWVPQTNMFHLAFNRTKRISDALAMIASAATKTSPAVPVQDFRIDWNMANATPFTEITVVLGPRD